MIFKSTNIAISKILIAAYVFMFTFSAYHNHDTCLLYDAENQFKSKCKHNHGHAISNKDCSLLQINSSSISYNIEVKPISFELSFEYIFEFNYSNRYFLRFTQIHLRGPPLV